MHDERVNYREGTGRKRSVRGLVRETAVVWPLGRPNRLLGGQMGRWVGGTLSRCANEDLNHGYDRRSQI